MRPTLLILLALTPTYFFAMQPNQLVSEPAAIAYSFTQHSGQYQHSLSSTALNQAVSELNSHAEISQDYDPGPQRVHHGFSNLQITKATKSIVKLAGAFFLFELGQNILTPEMTMGRLLSYTFGTSWGISSLYDAYTAVTSNASIND